VLSYKAVTELPWDEATGTPSPTHSDRIVTALRCLQWRPHLISNAPATVATFRQSVRDTQGKILARCKLLISFSEHSFIFATNNRRHFCPGGFTECNTLSLHCCGLMTQHPLDQRLEHIELRGRRVAVVEGIWLYIGDHRQPWSS
jgi:hypothetical protein